MKDPQANLAALASNPYPGRGIVIGMSLDRRFILIGYWIMGRSTNSRNRVFVLEGPDCLKTQPHDPSRVTDPSLIIYNAMRRTGDYEIVSNGIHTDTIHDYLASNRDFESSLRTWTVEPDPPNFTPRIAGFVNRARGDYALAIIRRTGLGDQVAHNFYRYDTLREGLGHCLTTYAGDGDPLPSFADDPLVLPLFANAQETLLRLNEALAGPNLVSIAVREIELGTGNVTTLIHNVLEEKTIPASKNSK